MGNNGSSVLMRFPNTPVHFAGVGGCSYYELSYITNTALQADSVAGVDGVAVFGQHYHTPPYLPRNITRLTTATGPIEPC